MYCTYKGSFSLSWKTDFSLASGVVGSPALALAPLVDDGRGRSVMEEVLGLGQVQGRLGLGRGCGDRGSGGSGGNGGRDVTVLGAVVVVVVGPGARRVHFVNVLEALVEEVLETMKKGDAVSFYSLDTTMMSVLNAQKPSLPPAPRFDECGAEGVITHPWKGGSLGRSRESGQTRRETPTQQCVQHT